MRGRMRSSMKGALTVGGLLALLVGAFAVLVARTPDGAPGDASPPVDAAGAGAVEPQAPDGASGGDQAGTDPAGTGVVSDPTAGDGVRLLTGLTAEVGPEGVTLVWRVDEARAGSIAGFTCVYRTPAHIELGVAGAVPCGPEPSPAASRSVTVGGLPEYGDYLFELVAETVAGESVPWPDRALQTRIEVTEELAGPPGAAVTGEGPLVVSCRPGDSAGPWSLDRIVSAAHLTHYPGSGWGPAGDPAESPEWPEPTPLADLMAEAGIEAEQFRRAISGEDSEAQAQTFADERFAEAVARAGRGTKALLRPGGDGGHELRLHSSYPFGDDYAFGPDHAVAGWADAAHPALWPELRNRTGCPPSSRPDATHDVALALAYDAGAGRSLAHAGYGWWAVSPVGLFAHRIVATKAGLSFGETASGQPEAGARWSGRLTGHLFWDGRRWAVAGDVVLALAPGGGAPGLAGRVENLVLAPIDPKTLEPAATEQAHLAALELGDGERTGQDGAWSGPLTLEAAGGGLAGFPAPDVFRGDWLAEVHGPAGVEAAGRLRLWTPLPAGADPAEDWPAQAVLVAGFGAVLTSP